MNRRQAIIAALLSAPAVMKAAPENSQTTASGGFTFAFEKAGKVTLDYSDLESIDILWRGKKLNIPVREIFNALEVKPVSDKLPVLDPSKPPCGGHSEGGYWVWSRPDCGPPIPNQVIRVVPKSHE